MGIIGKISSFVRSTIRRIKQRLWGELLSDHADLPLVHKRMGRDCYCPRFFFDAEDNLMDFNALRIIGPGNIG